MEPYIKSFHDLCSRAYYTFINTCDWLDSEQNTACTTPYDFGCIGHKWPTMYTQRWTIASTDHTIVQKGCKRDTWNSSRSAARSTLSLWKYLARCREHAPTNPFLLFLTDHLSSPKLKDEHNAFFIHLLRSLNSAIQDNHLFANRQLQTICEEVLRNPLQFS